MKPSEIKDRPPLFKKFKTYSAAEVIAAGDASAFGKATGFDAKKLYHLPGEALTDDELTAALDDLKRK